MSQKHVIQPTPRQHAREQAKSHELLQRLLAMSDEQVAAWLRANVNDVTAHAIIGALVTGLRDLHHR